MTQNGLQLAYVMGQIHPISCQVQHPYDNASVVGEALRFDNHDSQARVLGDVAKHMAI